jgi:hypothetical protein
LQTPLDASFRFKGIIYEILLLTMGLTVVSYSVTHYRIWFRVSAFPPFPPCQDLEPSSRSSGRTRKPRPCFARFVARDRRRSGLPALREAEGGVKICQRDAGACYPLFEVMNVPADFSTLETKSGNNVSFGHAADFRYYGTNATGN